MSQFLIELKIEEIPAGMQLNGEQAFKSAFEKFLKDNGVNGVTVKSASMSSRIALLADNLPARTEDVTEESRGPRVESSLDENGNPTRALEGFMRGQGIASVNDLERKDTPKGEFFFVTKQVAGKEMADMLAEALPEMIKNIPWPKSMRWGTGSMTFVRPLSNVLCVLDGKVVAFDVDGLQSNNKSFGHFFMHPEAFDVTSADQYFAQLTEREVMLCRDQRKEEIRKQIQEKANEINARWVADEKLLDEVAGLIEWPYAVLSQVDERFLDLPREVLITTMASHQKYFTLENEDGSLCADFVGISNMPAKSDAISVGYRKVLTARFDDAKFYWDMDRKQTLESRRPELEKIVFQKDLGTIAQKMARVESLVADLAPAVKGADVAKSKRVAQLAKCDLNSGVVYEFPELQGIIGGYLAQADGEAAEVVNAIQNQYAYTDFAGMTAEAQTFILADRLDTLVGFFGINQAPTGSKDPYALRRAALSIIRLMREADARVNLTDIVNAVYDNFAGVLTEEKTKTAEAVMDFLMGRLKVALREEGISHDLVDAVLSKGLDDVVDICNRTQALHNFMEGEDGSALYEAYKRASSILSGTKLTDVAINPSDLEPVEKGLFDACTTAESSVKEALNAQRYDNAVQSLSEIKSPLETFFDEVMVMAEDEAVRTKRLALLGQVSGLFDNIANFSKVQK